VPGLLNVLETLQALLWTVGGCANEPSSNTTLWKPPAFVQVTESPCVRVTVSGRKRSDGRAVTV
jgi:hypothetical protein